MNTAAAHYDTHLGPVYSWMIGDIGAALIRSSAELDDLLPPSPVGGTAVDLGCGFGLHSLPLAKRGYAVTAVDTCRPLLDELQARSQTLPITPINADLVGFPSYLQGPVDVILCMGDTLTHLPDFAAVDTLLGAVANSLSKGGLFAATFRDYVSKTLVGDERFILVRSDAERILTCFLEYRDDHVMVHDLLHQREDGRWRQRLSSYPKLRLDPGKIASTLTAHGLAVRRESGPSGMIRIVGKKP
jgi:2-polyprenyl-3-methyl-5-hydroxy-6-metoxy-1,4-benzoquinol methylase